MIDTTHPRWMSRVLLAAALYNILWGALVCLAPETTIRWLGIEPPRYPELWQCIGMLVGVYGVGFAIAARDPYRHWPIVLVGLLGKVLGPAGYAWAASTERLPWTGGLTILTNDLVWWIPFALILRGAAREHRAATSPPLVPIETALSIYCDDDGANLLESSRCQPLFIVFLRHFGCTFCREAVTDLRAARKRIESASARLVLVHMSSDEQARSFLSRDGLEDVTCISDPERVLYRAFTLGRGSFRQLFGWSVWKRSWSAGVVDGHGVGWPQGDGLQMPGAFVVRDGRVVQQFVHETAADRPDYGELAEESTLDDITLEEMAKRLSSQLG
jgi:peroxiredoxin